MVDFLKSNVLIRTLIGIIILMSASSSIIIHANAQSNFEEWSSPINLSNSGSSTNPQLVVDSNGTFHVIWIDKFDDYVYTQSSDGVQWSTPIPALFPFQVEDTLSLLLSDPSGYVHAFWFDSDDTLFYSRVLGAEFGNPSSWQGAIPLAESALDMDAIVDSTGILHLSYVRPLSSDQFPEGIYYRNSADNGLIWSNAVQLYQSKYFRSLNKEDAHVQISSTAIDGEEHIYVAWDNRPIRRVYIIYSTDGGTSWNNPTELAGPDLMSNNTPFNIMLYPHGPNILSIIQRGEPGLYCTQVSSMSIDQGATWSTSQPVYRDVVGCPQDNRFFILNDGIMLLQSIIQDQVYLTAWDDERWSITRKQSALFSFIDTFNNKNVAFGCRKMIKSDERLFVVGCDANENGDIWITSRTTGTISDWYPSTIDWSSTEVIASDSNSMTNPIILADQDSRFHAIWLQESEDNTNPAIFYSRLVNSNWSEPVSIVSRTDDSISYQSAAISNNGRILIVWSGKKSGAIYFSWANTDQAENPSEWADPVQISTSSYFSTSPFISIDDSGTIYVVFSVPINEGRGIYLTQSLDNGENWSRPIFVIDATAEGWDIVTSPKIYINQGKIHLIWMRNNLSNNGEATAIYYSSSENEAITWSTPEIIGESNPLWIDINGAGDASIHITWLENHNGSLLFNDQISIDQGNTWNLPINISNFSTIEGAMGIVKAPDNILHLVHIGEDLNNRQRLIHWSWVEQAWSLGEDIDIGSALNTKVDSLSVTTNADGNLAALFVTGKDDILSGETTYEIDFMSKQLLLPLIVPTPALPLIEPSPTGTSSPTATSTIEPPIASSVESTPENSIATDILQQPPARNNSLVALAIGILLSFIVIIIPFAFLARRFQKREGR